jgi:CBS domain-containing protein
MRRRPPFLWGIFALGKKQVLISEVLKAKHSNRWVDPVVSKHATVKEAILATIEGGLSGMMVLGDDTDVEHAAQTHPHSAPSPSLAVTTSGSETTSHPPQMARRVVVGLLTSRDLLRIMALGFKENESSDQVLNRRIGQYMTPISQVIYGRPEETVGMCRAIMAKLGIKCLPILSRQGRVEGLITARDMSDFGLTAKDKGGKQAFLNDVSQRVGLSSNTSMADPPQYLQAHLALDQSPLFINVGQAALPHPFKTPQGTSGRSQRGTFKASACFDLDPSPGQHICEHYCALFDPLT